MRVAIVDDQPLARETIRRFLTSLPGYSVAWTAEDGERAVRNAAADRPDVILMDLVMPKLDGVEATRQILKQTPCPIILCTSSITGNFTQVLQGMEAGAIAAVNKPVIGPDGNLRETDDLLARLEKISRTRKFPDAPSGEMKVLTPVVAIGASTGGPQAVATILGGLDATLNAAVVIAVHIDAVFTPEMVRVFQTSTKLPVVAVTESLDLKPNTVYVAVSNDHLLLSPARKLLYAKEPASYLYRPSVDVLFSSLATNYPLKGVAVLLTGMGKDGAKGLLQLKQAGWRTIAQDEATSVVYGMPKEAAVLNAAHQILPVGHIAGAIRANLPK
jgi:two-component system, chemotaxis family, response regulator WspF